jgi:hypothetical protein
LKKNAGLELVVQSVLARTPVEKYVVGSGATARPLLTPWTEKRMIALL